jgi:hypothetical protein
VVGVAALLAFAWLASTREPDVPSSEFIAGLVLGTLAIAVLPAAGYYALGRSLGGRPGWLVGVWLVTQAPLAFYLFVAAIYSLEMTHCGPEAYECPF